MPKQRQSGFTLIELVIVIAILGVLGATALPKVTSLQAYARIAKMQGIMASMKSTAVIGHALLIANGYPANFTGNPGEGGSVPDINVEGIDVVYEDGYPDAASILLLAGLSDSDTPSNTTPGDVVVPSEGVVKADPHHPLCKIVYKPVGPTFDSTHLTLENCR